MIVSWYLHFYKMNRIILIIKSFFHIEYATRLACSPRKFKFIVAPLNVIDLLAILPYFLSFAVDEAKVGSWLFSVNDLHYSQETVVVGRAGKLLRLIRMMRILRVFKFVRHLTGLQSLLSSIKHAYQELGLLMVLLWVISVTLSRYCQLQTTK